MTWQVEVKKPLSYPKHKKTISRSPEYSESIINTVREPLIALDQDLRVVSVSRSFYEVFKAKPEETVGQLIYDLGNKQWDIPKLRELLETILPQQTTFDNYEVEHDFTTIGRRVMLLNAGQIKRVLGKELQDIGFMVIRELRNDPELRKIKVIAVTSFAMRGDREKALQAGFDEYVTKPINTRTFPELIKQVLFEVQP